MDSEARPNTDFFDRFRSCECRLNWFGLCFVNLPEWLPPFWGPIIVLLIFGLFARGGIFFIIAAILLFAVGVCEKYELSHHKTVGTELPSPTTRHRVCGAVEAP